MDISSPWMSRRTIEMNIIDKAVEDNLSVYADQFTNARPFKYVVIDNFLDPNVARKLVDEFPSCTDPDALLNEFGTPNPKSAISNIADLGGIYAETDRAIQSSQFLRAIEAITTIQDLQYDPYYYGAGTHENFHGAGLDAHVDFNIHPVTRQHRRLNAIVYLNEKWDPSWGGQLLLHSNPYDVVGDQAIEVEPEFNRCVVFETNEYSWHSVKSIEIPANQRKTASRKSFTIYLYTADRPGLETAPSHGTLYVQNNLPGHLTPGHVLTQEDIDSLLRNFQRRNDYLKNLYVREFKFSGVISSLEAQLAATEHRIAVPISGAVTHQKTLIPAYQDGWMGAKLAFVVDTVRPVTTIKLVMRRPESMNANLAFALRVNDCLHEFVETGHGAIVRAFSFDKEISGEIGIELSTSNARIIDGSEDRRMLSIIIDRIEFL
jgi:Rps23 Pro-64 3,4-dihydroxylase Tpa1-like proline 4-hydroxylase